MFDEKHNTFRSEAIRVREDYIQMYKTCQAFSFKMFSWQKFFI